MTGSTSDGENYVFSSLPDTIYVGDTINIFNQNNDPNPQIYSINTNNGVVSVTEWDDNYYISGGRGKKARVIYAERPGNFQVNNKWIQVVNRPSGSHPETVSTVPNAEIGVTMNMFDYDLNSTLDDYFNQFNLVRQPFEQTFKNAGVNNGKTLKFWGSGINTEWYGGDDRASVSIDWSKNTYTTNDPGTGIVKNQLSGGTTGYPVLTGGNENLAYLFTDSNYNNDVRAYMGVDGLFQKDNEDYYYYDSSQNYAWLNPESKVFEVYGETYPQWSKGEIAAQGGYDNGKPIGFFPFHEWDPQHDRFVNWNKALNHHFGLNMEVQFAFPSGSMAPVDKNGKPIVFEFNGDDDMWVFIDGKLAMDIGGIHQPIDGKIDFTNRTVTVAGDTQTGYTSWDSLFDGKQHTLQVFYMERGGCDSNCKIKFNLSQYTDVELDKVDKKDPAKSLAGAKFQLFKEVQTIEGGQTVTKLEPVYWYKKQNPNDRQGVKTPYIAESDADGHVKFEGVSLGNYILNEIAAPPDYKLLTDVRSVPIYLTEENGSTVVKYSISGEDADTGREGVQIPNEKPVIDLFVEKTWLDADGQPMDASDYSATFTLRRTKSWTEIVEEEGEPEKTSTLRIGYYYNDWGGTHYGYYDNQTYHYVIGSDASVQYNYNNSHNNQSYNWRRYRINQGGTEVQNIADNGTIPVTMPPEGETVTVYLYDNWRNGSTFSSLSANGQTPQNTVIQREIPHVDDPDDFTRTLTLANGATSGKFDSGLYTGTLYAGKFPYQETIEQPDGKKITYTYKYYITEEPISGFSSSPSEAGPSGEEDFTGEFVNRKLISVKIKKVWVDGTNEDGTPTDHGDSLTVTLSNGHEVTLNDANHWEATISDLPKYDREGNLIEYSWTEGTLPSGYYLSDTSVVEDGDVVTTTLTNSYSGHYMPERDIDGVKIWDDNGDEQRPESITVRLYKNGEFYRQTTVLRPTQEGADPNQWPFRFTNVPVFNDDGTLAVYTVEEVLPEGYVTDYNVVIDAQTAQYEAGDATYKIINSYSPENRLDGNSVDLAFVVVRHGNDFVVWTPRPLQAGELNTIKDTVKGISNQFNQIMNATGDSLKIISGVPKNVTIKSGNKENVVVTASMKDGDLCIDFSDPSGQSDIVYGTIPYTYTQIGGEGGVNITNIKKTTSVSGTKTWVDGGREHNNANEITLKLSRTVKPVTADSEWSEVTVPETGTDVPTFAWDGNTYTYSYLPRYQDINDPATEYEYRVEETSVNVTEGEGGSQHTVSYKQEANGNDFINTELTSVEANKRWKSGDTSINSTMRNASVTLKLQKKVGSSGSWEDVPAEAGILENPKTIAVEEADENAWSVTWDDLPKYSLVDGAVVAIQYQVVETEALISDTSVKPEADPIVSVTDGVADVINTLPETEISVTKQWKDGTTPEGGNDCIFDEEKTIQFTVYRKVGNNDPAVYEAYGDNGKGIVTYTPGEGSSVGTWQTVVVSGLPKYVYDESAQAWAEAAYYVVEEAIDGVTITYKKGSGTATGTAESAAVTDDDSEENRTITIINTDILVPVKILKVDKTTAEGLSGAKFQLTRKLSGEGSFTKFVHSDFEEDPENDNKKTGPFTISSVDGIVLEGLHPGEYRIEEKKAPDGYIISLQPFTFTVNADGSVSSTDADALLVLHLEKAGTDPEGFKIANEPGAALPNTGGSGTWLFTILGSILIIGAGVLLWRRRRLE